MRDLFEQLRDYGEALAGSIDPVTTDEAIDPDRRRSEGASTVRRDRRRWVVAATAAAIVVLVVGAFAIAGRGDQPYVGPGPVPAAQLRATLIGREFHSTGVTEDGRPREIVGPSPTDGGAPPRIRLSFIDEQVGWSAGCNSSGGPYTVTESRLVVEQVATTAAGCEPRLQEQDLWLSGVLTSSPTLALHGDLLTVTSGSTVIELVDAGAQAPAPEHGTTSMPEAMTIQEVEGRRFRSTAVSEHGVVRDLAPSFTEPYVGPPSRLEMKVLDGELTATGGCGGATFVSTAIVAGQLSVAERGQAPVSVSCGPALDEQEAWFFAFLESGPAISLAGDQMVLTGEASVIELVDTRAALSSPSVSTAPTTSLPGSLPLVDVRWELDHLVGPTTSWVPSPNEGDLGAPFLDFRDDFPLSTGEPTVRIYDGCQQFVAGYVVAGPSLTFGEPLNEAVPCATETDEMVAAFATLAGETSFEIVGDTLTIEAADTTLVLRGRPIPYDGP